MPTKQEQALSVVLRFEGLIGQCITCKCAHKLSLPAHVLLHLACSTLSAAA